MNQSTIFKKKGLNLNKARSQLKNLDIDMQYRSSAKLANKFMIKIEKLVMNAMINLRKSRNQCHIKGRF